MAAMKDSKALAGLMFEEPPEEGGEATEDVGEDDTEAAYTEASQAVLDAIGSGDLEGFKAALRDATHFAGLLGPSEMSTEEASADELEA